MIYLLILIGYCMDCYGASVLAGLLLAVFVFTEDWVRFVNDDDDEGPPGAP